MRGERGANERVELMSLLVLVMAAALAAGDASASTTAPSPPPKASNNALDPDKVICRQEADTGSRFEKRICHTRAQWDEMSAHAQEMQRQNSQRAGLGVTQSNPMGGH